MRVVLQKVKSAVVMVDEKRVGEIAQGYLLLLGITHTDTRADADKLVEKILKLRLFSDEGSDTFMQKNIVEQNGELLIVSQFTLFADTQKGTRPSFSDAARPQYAKELYEYFIQAAKKYTLKVEVGQFGAHMHIDIEADGPITLIIDSKNSV